MQVARLFHSKSYWSRPAMRSNTGTLRSVRSSRRAVLKRGGVVSGALALGLSSTGTEPATAQADVPVGKAFMFNDEFRPGARFRVVSGIIEEQPTVEGIEEQDVWSEANTRIIEYLNTGERVSLFPIEQADIERGQTYELSSQTLGLFDLDEGIVTIEYAFPDTDDDGADQSPSFDTVEGGGKALVRTNNFYPGALFWIVSGVVDWTPRGDVRGSDPFSEYNTRYGEYRNANDEFLLYPAHAAEIEEGATYVMRDEFDITDPEGALLTADIDRVDEESLEKGSSARASAGLHGGSHD